MLGPVMVQRVADLDLRYVLGDDKESRPHIFAAVSFENYLTAGAQAAPWTPLGGLPPPRWPPRTVGQPRGGPKVTNRRAIFDLAANSDA